MSFQDVKAIYDSLPEDQKRLVSPRCGLHKSAGLSAGLVGAARGVLGRYWHTEGPTFANRLWKTIKAAPGEAYRGYATGNDAVTRAVGSHIVRPAVVRGARWARSSRFTPAPVKRALGAAVRGRSTVVNTANMVSSGSPNFNATAQLAMDQVPGVNAAYNLMFSNGVRRPALPRAFQSWQRPWSWNT